MEFARKLSRNDSVRNNVNRKNIFDEGKIKIKRVINAFLVFKEGTTESKYVD